jgi:hypothetical protein
VDDLKSSTWFAAAHAWVRGPDLVASGRRNRLGSTAPGEMSFISRQRSASHDSQYLALLLVGWAAWACSMVGSSVATPAHPARAPRRSDEVRSYGCWPGRPTP